MERILGNNYKSTIKHVKLRTLKRGINHLLKITALREDLNRVRITRIDRGLLIILIYSN